MGRVVVEPLLVMCLFHLSFVMASFLGSASPKNLHVQFHADKRAEGFSSNKENLKHLRNCGLEESVSLIKSLFLVGVCQTSFHPSHKGLRWLPGFEGTQAASLTADRARVHYRPIGSSTADPAQL